MCKVAWTVRVAWTARGVRTALVVCLILLCFSCAPGTFTIRSANLYPLYTYTPENNELTLFAALFVNLEHGSTQVRRIRLENSTGTLFWEVNLEEEGNSDDSINRLPWSSDEEEEEEYVVPSIAAPEGNSTFELFYPWFLSPGENTIPDDIYSLTLWDYSSETSQSSLRFENLDDDDLQNLETHLASLSFSAENDLDSYEVLSIQGGNSPFNLSREPLEAYSVLPESAAADSSTDLFLWGVPAGIDCIVLAGPY